jgi:hypothetical protein
MARTKTTGLAAFTNRGSALAAPDEAPPAAAVATSRAPAHAPAAAGRARGQVAPAGRKRGQGATVAPACAWRAPIGGAAASAPRRRRREPAGNQSCAGCRRCSHPKACQASAHDVLTSSRQNLQSAAVSFSRAAAARLCPFLGPHLFELLGDLGIDQRDAVHGERLDLALEPRHAAARGRGPRPWKGRLRLIGRSPDAPS